MKSVGSDLDGDGYYTYLKTEKMMDLTFELIDEDKPHPQRAQQPAKYKYDSF